jgi:hypothetical protein
VATKKDLVEAYAFSRRRLVTAFVSGAPGGREVEPARPGRAVIGGIALAVLLLAGAGILRILGTTPEFDPTQQQLVSEKESGADYVLIETPGSDGLLLRPVVNITSAMLLLGAEVEPTVLPREELADRTTPGEPIGILQAPATPPPVDSLVNTGWTACTGTVDGEPVGLAVNVSSTPAVEPTPGVSFVVRAVGDEPDDPGRLFLIAEAVSGTGDGLPSARAYELPDQGDAATAVLGAVAASSPAQAVDVPADWVTTFEPGGALELATFGLTPRDLRQPFGGRTDSGPLAGTRVGDVLDVGESSYLLTARGNEVVLLDDFSRAVYLGSVPGRRDPIDAGDTPPPGIDPVAPPELAGAGWPSVTTSEPPSGELCSLLRTSPGFPPAAVLARADPGGPASAADVAPGERVARVDPGAGALVRSGGWTDAEASTRVLVDDRGVAYRLAGETESDNLGYAGLPAEVAPDSWVELFLPGVPLSIDAARCPPTSRPDGASCG